MMPLTLAEVGEENIIKKIGGKQEVKAHLETLGFVVGGAVTVVSSIGSITKAIDDGAAGITGAADSTQSLAADMADISNRMDMNQEIVEELQKQTKIFANL